MFTVEDTKDMVYIGSDLPDEYTHSNYTMILKGANAKAKANATVGLPEMIEIADEKELIKASVVFSNRSFLTPIFSILLY